MKADDMIESLARLASLPKASRLHGYPSKYYSLRRPQWRAHVDPALRFPEPIIEIRGVPMFDILELALWDARRKQASPQGRALTNKETKR